MTGGIIEAAAIAEYATVAASLDGIAPTCYCPGNSDPRRPFCAALLPDLGLETGGDDAPVNYARTLGALTVIMLDSSVPGHYHGALAEGSIAWLRATLAALPPDEPVLLGLHHPPVAIGHPRIDPLRLLDAKPLAVTVRDYPQIAAALVGHTHAATATSFAGKPLLVAPGVYSGLYPPWEPSPEGGPLIDEAAPPALALHLIDGDRRPITYFRALH